MSRHLPSAYRALSPDPAKRAFWERIRRAPAEPDRAESWRIRHSLERLVARIHPIDAVPVALNKATRLKTEQVKRLKDLDLENSQLRKAVSDLTLDKLILRQAARGNF